MGYYSDVKFALPISNWKALKAQAAKPSSSPLILTDGICSNIQNPNASSTGKGNAGSS